MDEIVFDECLLHLDNLSALLDTFVSNEIEDISVEVSALISKNILIVKGKLEQIKFNKAH